MLKNDFCTQPVYSLSILLAIKKRRDSSQQLVRRVRVILLAAEQQTNEGIAPQVDLGLARK